MRVFYLLALCCIVAMTGRAQSTNWTGTASTSWTDPGNWTNGAPVTGGTAFIPFSAPNWPHMGGSVVIDFLLQNGGQLFIDGTADNFNNIQNFPGAVVTVNGTAYHRGPSGFDNSGVVFNNGLFVNYGPLTISGSGALFQNNPGGTFTNVDGGNVSVYATFRNDGAMTNNGFFLISGEFYSTGTCTNNKTLSLSPGASMFLRPACVFNNAAAPAFVEIKGTMTNDGSFDNLGGLRVVPGGLLVNNGTFNNKSVVNVAGELVNNGTYNNGCPSCTDVVTTWNEAGAVFRNNLTVNNYATLEILQCSKFYQNSAILAAITGKVWIMGIVYEIKGTIDQSSIMGGIVLHSETEMIKPMAMCKPAAVTLDATGVATITPQMIDNMSTYDYCSGGSLTVTPATVNCSNVGTVQVTLTARDFQGLTSSCTATVTVNASAACGNTSCVTAATRNTADNLVKNSGTNCVAGQPYSLWLNGLVPGKGNYYLLQNGVFEEKADGTARLTGLAVNSGDANVKFAVDVTFTGRTFVAPSGSPKPANCYTIDAKNWYYYTSTTGTLTGQGSQAGGVVKITRNGPSFQLGVGANLNEATQFGASGWFNTQVVSTPAGVNYGSNGGDFNFRLSGNPLFNCSDPGIDPPKCYKLVNKCTGQVLEIGGSSCADGTPSQSNNYGGSAYQCFNFGKNTDGSWTLTCKADGKVLDISGGSTSDDAACIQWPKHGGANQCFDVWPVGDGCVKFQARHSGKCLKTKNPGTTCGNPVVQCSWSESCDAAKWKLVEVPCPTVVCQPATCNKSVLMVIGSGCGLNCAEQAIKNKLTGKGFSVTTKLDYNVQASDCTGKGLVIISSTSLSSNIGTRLTNTAAPILCWEPQLYDELKMVSTGYGLNSIGSGSADVRVQKTHPITSGLSGDLNIVAYCQDLAYGNPCNSANSILNFCNSTGRSAVFAYDKGATLCNGAAAAGIRVGFPAYDNTASNFTADGWKLFLNTVYWMTGCPNVGYAQANPNQFVFNAYKSRFDVELKWINRHPKDVVKYAVERSADGQDWQEVTSFDGDFESEYFSEMDLNPLPGDNFYRLRMTMLDGTDRYSEEQLVNFNQIDPYTAFPNPAAEETFLDLRELAGRSANINFISSTGRLEKSVRIDEIGDEPVRLSTEGLCNGLWLLQVESDKLRPVTVKLLVSHLD